MKKTQEKNAYFVIQSHAFFQHFKHQLKHRSIRLNKEDNFASCYSIVEYNKDEKNDHIDLLHMDMFRYPDTTIFQLKSAIF